MNEEVDAYSQKPDVELEKYRTRFGLYKVIFGTAIVGIISVLVPGAIEFWKVTFEHQRLSAQFEVDNKRKELEIELNQINQQQEYVKDFLDTALNQDVELRIRFADYFSNVSADPFREDWTGYRDALVKKRNVTRLEIHTKEEAFMRGSSISSPTIEQQIENEKLSRELEWRYREIGYVARDRSIVRSESEAKDTERSLASTISSGNLVRIVMHSTHGNHRASASDRQHYHEIVEGDGTRVRGDKPPEANISTVDRDYVAHTRGTNTGSIGLAVAAMAGAHEAPFIAGPYPITIVQLNAFCALVVDYARRYDIPITRETVLTHAEVEPTLGRPQRGKWDLTWLPGMASPGDPIEVGDRLREMIRAALDAPSLPNGQHGHCDFQPEAKPTDGDE